MDNFKVELVKETLMKFQSEKVMTIEQIAKSLNRSIPTARNRLKQWGAITSYNKNGCYYVLPHIAKFDSSGIWKFKDVLFSRHGNLRDTVFYFVDNSDAGLSASELNNLLGLPTYSFLSRHNNSWGLPKEKHQEIYIYFSKDTNIFERQIKERRKFVHSQAKEKLPSAVHSILILAELIKHPRDTPRQLVKRVRRNGVVISIEDVRNLLIYHDVLKKTSDLGQFEL